MMIFNPPRFTVPEVFGLGAVEENTLYQESNFVSEIEIVPGGIISESCAARMLAKECGDPMVS